MINEKEFKERCADILRKNITFSHQVGDYIIHGALDELWKLHIEQGSINTNVVRPTSDLSDGGELLPAEGLEQGGSDGEPYYCEFCGSDEGGHMYGCPNGKYG